MMKRLHIAMATPCNARSAIGAHAMEVAFELTRRGHQVTILRTEVGEAAGWPPLRAPGAVCHIGDVSDEFLAHGVDIVVAEIGNHHGFHGALLTRLGGVEMVGVFHDAFIGDLAGASAGGEKNIRALIGKIYGEHVLPPGRGYLDDLNWAARHAPMVEWLARDCVAAVAHGGHYVDRLRASCPGPVGVMPLALTFPRLPPVPPQWDGLQIAVVGHANPNKRIDQLILAIGASPKLRTRCRIRVIGEAPSDVRAKLSRIAAVVGVAPLQFTGWVPDEDLPWALRDVDVISCLRNPALEGASASLLLAMTAGRPTLVTNHGAYAEVPADAVLRCAPAHEARDACRHLERLLDDPARFAAVGARARAHVAGRHTPSAYVDALLPLLEAAVARRHLFAARRHLAGTLAEFGLRPDDPAAGRIASVLSEFDATSRPVNCAD